jgi:hypothetical protein
MSSIEPRFRKKVEELLKFHVEYRIYIILSGIDLKLSPMRQMGMNEKGCGDMVSLLLR